MKISVKSITINCNSEQKSYYDINFWVKYLSVDLQETKQKTLNWLWSLVYVQIWKCVLY